MEERPRPFHPDHRGTETSTSLLSFRSPGILAAAVWCGIVAVTLALRMGLSPRIIPSYMPVMSINAFLLISIAGIAALFIKRKELVNPLSGLLLLAFLLATSFELAEYLSPSSPSDMYLTLYYFTSILLYFLLLSFSTLYQPLPVAAGALIGGSVFFLLLASAHSPTSPLFLPLLLCCYLLIFAVILFLRIYSTNLQKMRRLNNRLKRSRAAIIEREKHMSLMRMTAGLSHQINNPLMYGKGNIQYLKEAGAELQNQLQVNRAGELQIRKRLEEQFKMADRVEDALNRIQRVVTRLRYFACHPEDPPEHIDLRTIVKSCIDMTVQAQGGRIRCVTALPDALPYYGRPKDFFTLFTNILENAIEAHDGKGESNAAVHVSAHRSAARLRIRFTDNGRGIPPELLERVEAPFYTAKEVDGHLGLGLSICRSILQSYGGRITLRSSESRWTRVDVVLPPAGKTAEK